MEKLYFEPALNNATSTPVRAALNVLIHRSGIKKLSFHLNVLLLHIALPLLSCNIVHSLN